MLRLVQWLGWAVLHVALIGVIGPSRGSNIAHLNWPKIETPRRKEAQPS